jgi:hypothetical protein
MSETILQASNLTIIFSGLMIFHKYQQRMEVGIVPAPGHRLRIRAITGGVVGGPVDITAELEKRGKAKCTLVLQADYPHPIPGVTISSYGKFVRKNHPYAEDFNWVMDLEGDEFYDREVADDPNYIDTTLLQPLLHFPFGRFYTAQKSVNLKRAVKDPSGPAKDFGSIVARLGYDLLFVGNTAHLVIEETHERIFTFRKGPGVVYEILNTPLKTTGHHAEAGAPGDTHPAPAEGHEHPTVAPSDYDHFQFYYMLIKDPKVKKYTFQIPSGDGPAGPVPDPQLCGPNRVGKKTKPLGEPEEVKP